MRESPEAMLIVGLMSGTSCDGIDAAVVEIGGTARPRLLHFQSSPMPERLREPALRLAAPGVHEIDPMGALDVALGQAFADAALSAI
ncbi:MAG TPA: anhydro-N-acetylmuramic acid kinase, partial [Mariprofundaceae bacterium]|nr:anhydro-N-acetylmuramic acid kinase [Mariprofundaceae bacterium]